MKNIVICKYITVIKKEETKDNIKFEYTEKEPKLRNGIVALIGLVVTLDEEKKAAMVSNLLVVLCSNKEVQPVVNSRIEN